MYLVASAIFAVFSIPSAYMLGLSIPLRMGLDSLLDSSFFSRELFRFALLVVGVSAFSRPVVGYLSVAFGVSHDKPDQKKSIGTWLKSVRYAFIAAAFIVAIFAILIPFLNKVLVVPFVLFLLFNFNVTMLFYIVMKEKAAQFERIKISEYLSTSIQPRSYLTNPYLLVANLGFVLVAAVTFGYLRTISMSLSHPYCIAMKSKSIEAAILGRTEFGLVVAVVEPTDWTPITIPTGMSWISPKVYSIVNLDDVISISWACE